MSADSDRAMSLLLKFGPKPQFRRFVLENRTKLIRVYPRSRFRGAIDGYENWIWV